MTKYTKLANDEGYIIDSNEERLRLACCDCGMVHTYVFIMKGNKHEKLAGVSLKKNEVIPIIRSEPRATAQLRRHEYGYLHNPVEGDKYRIMRKSGK